MSCLSISELPLAEQVELELAYAERLAARAQAVLSGLEARPIVRNRPMLERQVTIHPELSACKPDHRPHMWATGVDGAAPYFVECSACAVRTRPASTKVDAAYAWAARDTYPIQPRSAA